MSDWSELCNMMNIDNDEDALDKVIDQFIADDKEAGLISDNTSQSNKKAILSKKNRDDGSGGENLDDDIPF
ncbi:MAG: hypothetical protein ACK4ML_02045 [Alishewanella aestuarii]